MHAIGERQDTWTGGEHYWIQPHERGGYVVMMETPEWDECNAEVYRSSTYIDCVVHLRKILEDNYEYDHDL